MSIDILDSLHAVVLAAGRGTRMHSPRSKVLATLLGEPMLWYVYQTLEPLCAARVLTVVGHGADEVAAIFPQQAERFVTQSEQLGTGHAVVQAWPNVLGAGAEYVLVVNGDTPLITTRAVEQLVSAAQSAAADLAFASITPCDPAAFGRVLRDDAGEVRAIVEFKDYDPAVHGQDSGEVNAGIYVLRAEAIGPLLPLLSNDNASGEFYITDLVDLAVVEGLSVHAECFGDAPELMGINSPAELVAAENWLASDIATRWLARGVLIRNPDAARIGPRVELAPGCEVCAPCELLGRVAVAQGARIDANCVVHDAELAAGAWLRHFSHVERAVLGPGATAGPYARLRPGAQLQDGSRVGNFVEMKKAVLGPGAKANHLTYLGDAEVGAGANIGAGTITCNYDGANKHATRIGEGAFIGSNTALVAPIRIGDRALVGAGSTLTKDVEDDQLAIARSRQKAMAKRR